MPLTDAQRIPVATYRLQLHGKFGFRDVERLARYFHELGVSDLYFSPIMESAPGSEHGYDVSDYRKIDAELGGGDAFHRLSDQLRALNLGLLVDFVPNHMGINGPFNLWWRDVLECGEHSPHARFFDIFWNAVERTPRRRVLVPMLDDHYGRVLEQGRLQLRYRDRALALVFGETVFPLSPHSYAKVLSQCVESPLLSPAPREELRHLIERFASLPQPEETEHLAEARERARQIEGLKRDLATLLHRQAEVQCAVEATLRELNGAVGDPHSFDALDAIVEEQHYRLAHWKAGAHETNYRRFFAVDTLIGLRMENPEVFHESHLLIGHLVQEGKITGLRIDHVDGLWDPQEYLERLQQLARARADGERPPLFVVVEKILAEDEQLPATWPTHGTTGYEFIAQLGNLFVNPAAERRFNEIYHAFTGEPMSFDDLVYAKKRLVLEELFANSVNNLANALVELLLYDRSWRDLTRHELTVAVRELMAGMEVYRTYRRMQDGKRAEDRKQIEEACVRAIRRNPRIDSQAFEFVRDLLTGDYPPADVSEDYRARLAHWMLTFQQYTGAVMAKAVEDTAFYIYNRLIALNEVGGHPARFGAGVERFHAANEARRERAPHTLLATSTHDTKLSEDVRARLYALSEIPDEWESWLAEWRQVNRRHKSLVDGRVAPDANEEYRLYQILLGAWPLDEAELDATFRQRIRDHLRKAVNEAKVNTTWIHPNEPWLEAGDRFVDALLTDDPQNDFLPRFRPRAQRLAHLGMVNALAQVVLKITAPGIPDFYQGNESWDFSLVDPDNRRPVDYVRRQLLMESSQERSPRELLREWKSGGIKWRVTQTLLTFRREHAALFREGTYSALSPAGRFADSVVAFLRRHEREAVLTIVPRLSARLGCPPLGLVWDDTALLSGEPRTRWRDVLTGREFASEELLLADVLEHLPFAVLRSA